MILLKILQKRQDDKKANQWPRKGSKNIKVAHLYRPVILDWTCDFNILDSPILLAV